MQERDRARPLLRETVSPHSLIAVRFTSRRMVLGDGRPMQERVRGIGTHQQRRVAGLSMAPLSTHPALLAGRVAVVTGAARGIGRAAAIALASAGADIVGIDIAAHVSPILDFAPASREDLSETGRLVSQRGVRWLSHVIDQRDIAALREAADSIEERWGGVDIVFANAGIQAFKPLLEMADADWQDQIDVNLTGTANTLRAFAPHLVRRGGGRIIVTSSTKVSTALSTGPRTPPPSGASSV